MAHSVVLRHGYVILIALVERESFRIARRPLHIVIIVEKLAQIVFEECSVEELRVSKGLHCLLGLLEELLAALVFEVSPLDLRDTT